jgi:hypothetical protein
MHSFEYSLHSSSNLRNKVVVKGLALEFIQKIKIKLEENLNFIKCKLIEKECFQLSLNFK